VYELLRTPTAGVELGLLDRCDPPGQQAAQHGDGERADSGSTRPTAPQRAAVRVLETRR
jgi:hypothetical protein